MKRIWMPILVAIVLCVVSLVRIDGFSVSKIQGKLLDGSPAPVDEECRSILNQSFHYLGKGRQCFVFVSDDGHSVIKLINYRRFSLPNILPRWLEKVRSLEEKRKHRFDQTMKSFQLAVTYLPQETGMLYLHLQRGGDLPVLRLEDRAHRKHHIDLNEVAFVLQKRATPIFEELTNRFQKGGIESLKQGVAEFAALIDRRCSLLIADDDRDVEINYGFSDGHIMLLDPGRLYFDHSLKDQERIAREKAIASKRLNKWLSLHYPDFFESVRHNF